MTELEKREFDKEQAWLRKQASHEARILERENFIREQKERLMSAILEDRSGKLFFMEAKPWEWGGYTNGLHLKYYCNGKPYKVDITKRKGELHIDTDCLSRHVTKIADYINSCQAALIRGLHNHIPAKAWYKSSDYREECRARCRFN